MLTAIAREKQLKGWKRERKIALIENGNPQWRDLSRSWYEKPVKDHVPGIALSSRRGPSTPRCARRSG